MTLLHVFSLQPRGEDLEIRPKQSLPDHLVSSDALLCNSQCGGAAAAAAGLQWANTPALPCRPVSSLHHKQTNKQRRGRASLIDPTAGSFYWKHVLCKNQWSLQCRTSFPVTLIGHWEGGCSSVLQGSFENEGHAL